MITRRANFQIARFSKGQSSAVTTWYSSEEPRRENLLVAGSGRSRSRPSSSNRVRNMDPTQVRVAEFARNVIPTLFLHRGAVRFGLRERGSVHPEDEFGKLPKRTNIFAPGNCYSKKAARFLELRNTRFKRRVSSAPIFSESPYRFQHPSAVLREPFKQRGPGRPRRSPQDRRHIRTELQQLLERL